MLCTTLSTTRAICSLSDVYCQVKKVAEVSMKLLLILLSFSSTLATVNVLRGVAGQFRGLRQRKFNKIQGLKSSIRGIIPGGGGSQGRLKPSYKPHGGRGNQNKPSYKPARGVRPKPSYKLPGGGGYGGVKV